MTNQTQTRKEETMGTRILLGKGQCSWPRYERVTDRYGLVGVDPGSGRYEFGAEVFGGKVGQYGRLEAVVLETRRSGHIGDIARGIFPTTPEVGDAIILGEGTLFFETLEEAGETHQYVGLSPGNGRGHDWLDPHALYRCHEQTVELWFVPLAKDKPPGPI